MQPVLNSKTDAQGQFTFDYPALGAQPMLVRAIYRGVNFHQALPAGRNDVEVQVFDPSRDPRHQRGKSHCNFSTQRVDVIVGEEYSIKNNSQPPQAFSAQTAVLILPCGQSGSEAGRGSGAFGMPVVQTPIERGKSRFSVAYAFRPGDTVCAIPMSFLIPAIPRP